MVKVRTGRDALEVVVLVTTLWSWGCGGSSDEDSGGTISDSTEQSVEGIYELTAFTRNESGCDSEGPSLLDQLGEQTFVIVGDVVFGQRVLYLTSCVDAEDCRAKVIAIEGQMPYSHEYRFTLSAERSPQELTGFEAGSGFNESGTCVEREYIDHVLTAAGDTVHVESRTKLLADAPAEDGVCWAEPRRQRQEAASRVCTSLTVLEGRRLSGL